MVGIQHFLDGQRKLRKEVKNWFLTQPYRSLREWKRFIPWISIILIFLAFWFSLPNPLFNNPTSLVLEDDHGDLLGASIATDSQWRFPKGKEVPENFAQALVQFEDKRFYYHPGIDPISLYRAIRQNLRAGKIKSGGSTLTMQVIRLFRQKPRTIWEKIYEMVLALRLELSYSKKEILQLYAENAPFGSNIVGLEAASWRYFGRSSQQLSWAESATLAVLPNNPNWVRPGKKREILEKKRNQVLKTLFQRKIINKETYTLALEEPIPGKPKELPSMAPHLLEMARKQYRTGSSSLIHSSIQKDLQERATEILQEEIPQLGSNYIHNAAILVLDVETGASLAYVGNIIQKNKDMESDVDVIQAPRSPGSTLKPLLYASMLSEGIILPHSLVADIPTNYSGYSPQNFDLGYDGAVPASNALSRSLNVPAVRMLYDYKYPRFYDLLKNLGITTLNQPADFYGLSLILGGEEVKLWDLCGIYASMARTLNHQSHWKNRYNRNDFHGPLYTLEEINKVKNLKPELISGGILNYSSLWYTFQAMEEVQRPGDESLWRDWSSSQRIAWKTGTSFGFRDAWAIGLSPKYVVGVWVGNTSGEGRPGLIGIRAAAPILFKTFRALPSGSWFSFPNSNTIAMKVCSKSGYRAGEFCDQTEWIQTGKSSERVPICPFHQLIHLNKEKTYRVSSDCYPTQDMVHMPWFSLTPTEEWYYRIKNPFYQPLPPYISQCQSNSDESSPIGMIYPDQDAKIYVPIDLDGRRGKVVFKAAQRGIPGKLYWHLDSKFIGETNRFHEMEISPEIGQHRLTLEDQSGNTFVRRFEIIQPEKLNTAF